MIRSEGPCRAEMSAILQSGLGFPPTDTHPEELQFSVWVAGIAMH